MKGSCFYEMLISQYLTLTPTTDSSSIFGMLPPGSSGFQMNPSSLKVRADYFDFSSEAGRRHKVISLFLNFIVSPPPISFTGL